MLQRWGLDPLGKKTHQRIAIPNAPMALSITKHTSHWLREYVNALAHEAFAAVRMWIGYSGYQLFQITIELRIDVVLSH
jgi:hypothetical protein